MSHLLHSCLQSFLIVNCMYCQVVVSLSSSVFCFMQLVTWKRKIKINQYSSECAFLVCTFFFPLLPGISAVSFLSELKFGLCLVYTLTDELTFPEPEQKCNRRNKDPAHFVKRWYENFKKNLSCNEENPSIPNSSRNLTRGNEFGGNEVLLSAKDLKVCCKEGDSVLNPHFMLLMHYKNGLKESQTYLNALNFVPFREFLKLLINSKQSTL